MMYEHLCLLYEVSYWFSREWRATYNWIKSNGNLSNVDYLSHI